eukprot:34914-Eustigmatos_ZCMA.PRE.1
MPTLQFGGTTIIQDDEAQRRHLERLRDRKDNLEEQVGAFGEFLRTAIMQLDMENQARHETIRT